MQMMMGPVTTGGKKRMILRFAPKAVNQRADRSRRADPEQATPHAGIRQHLLGVAIAVRRRWQHSRPGKRKAGTQERGHLALCQEMEQQRAQTRARAASWKRSDPSAAGTSTVAPNMANMCWSAQNQQLRRAQGFGIVNAFGVIDLFAHDILLSVGGAAGPAAGRTQRTKAAKGNSCVFNNCSLAFLYSIAGFAGNCKMEEGIW